MAWPRWGGGDREWEESGKFDNERGTERGRKREGRGRRHRETRKKDKGPRPTIALLCQDFGREAVSLGPKAKAGEKDLQQRKELF